MRTKTRFPRLIEDYDSATHAERAAIEQTIHHLFSSEKAVVTLDMSGFTSHVQEHGVLSFVSMVRRMQLTTAPIVERHGGEIVKFDADNMAAVFDTVDDSVAAAFDIMRSVDASNRDFDEARRMAVKMGIAFGRILLVPDWDFNGEAVNISSKLGEDLAQAGEILVGRDAFDRIEGDHGLAYEEVRFQVSGINIDACRLKWRQS